MEFLVSLAWHSSSAPHQALVAVVIQLNALQVAFKIQKTERSFGHIGSTGHSGCEQSAWDTWEKEGQQGQLFSCELGTIPM